MNARKAALLGTALGLATLAPQIATAQDPGLYLGGGIGYNRIEGEDFTGDGDDFEDDRVSYKGIAGFKLGRMLSLEGQYIDFGTAEDGDNRVEADGWTAGAVLDLPLTENFSIYGKGGALFWDAEGRFANVRVDDDGTDPFYGAGARFALSQNLGLRIEYERFELNDTDIDMASANLLFHF